MNNGPKPRGSTDRSNFSPRVQALTSLLSMNNLTDKTRKAVKYMWIYGNQITNVDELGDFSNLIYLNIYGNNLNSINGLEGLTNIEYLRLADNKLVDDEEKQNNESDSLYVLRNLKKLYWLDISKNSNIKYISYLSGLEKLRYLYMDGCEDLSNEDVMSMKDFINGMIDKTFDSKYTKKLLDVLNQTKIDYSNQTIDFEDFKVVGQCTKLEYLDLTNTKVVKSQSDNLSENENTVENIMKNVFKNLTCLNSLSINNLTINFNNGSGEEKISKLNFLQLTDNSETGKGLSKKLTALDIRNTNITAKGEISTDGGVSKENTNLLNSLAQLCAIAINTNKFDFSKLQTMINRFDGEKYVSPRILGFGYECRTTLF